VAAIFVEDDVAVAETVRHHLRLGFRTVLLFTPEEIALGEPEAPRVTQIACTPWAPGVLPATLTRLARALPGRWIYFCFNAEFLFFPFCETRTVRDLLAFHTGERRRSMAACVVDLYAPNLVTCPDGVSLACPHLDVAGYYALDHRDPDNGWQPKDRQIEIFGGLRRRFEEHVPHDARRIDRVPLFRARRGLSLRDDLSFSDEEMNTRSCPWHRNVTAAVCSFRAAKALRRNPGSRAAIDSFRWRGSRRFDWSSEQLMDLGFMEAGQWF
jgi:hypothetical protein